MKKLLGLLLALALLTGCAQTGQGTQPPGATTAGAGTGTPASRNYGRTLTVMTHDSFATSEGVINAFQDQYQVNVKIIKAGDAGTALNKAILSKNNPLADVFYGVDNTFLSRALSEGIYEAYDSPALKDIPAQFQLDPQYNALPVDYGDVCLNYDKNYFATKNLPPPASLEDLVKPEYKGLTVVENPATSSPGLAFLLATIGHFGENGYLDYWKQLRANDVQVDNDWNTAYYNDFVTHGGARPVVVSYSSSPPAEVIFAEKPTDVAPTGVVTGGDSCFRQIEFVGILKGTKNPDLAQKWVDFMLSPTFQNDMPLQMFVSPVNQNAKLPPEYAKYLVEPKSTAQVSPEAIAANREQWIQAWTDAVLR